MASSAERQRRYRRHQAGDHSLCDPARGCVAQVPVTERGQPPEPEAAPGGIEDRVRGPRGAQLWAAMADAELSPAHRLLLDQACQMADRADRLYDLIGKRKAWLTTETDDGGRVVLVVDAVLAEVRQLETAIGGVITKFAPAVRTPAQGKAPKKEGGLAQLLRDELAERRGSAAG